MLPTLTPWMLGGAAVLLVVSNIATGWKAYEFGGNAEKVKCERRVDDMQAEWNKEVAKNKATEKAWTDAITKVLEAGGKEATDLQAEIDALTKKVEDYETSVGNDPNCALNQRDIDSLQ